MTATELFQAGRLDEAIAALGAELREHPDDAQRRRFLFELLCFAGQYDRAERQLDVLGAAAPDAGVGALFYRAALAAERTRQAHFDALASGTPEAAPEGAPTPTAARPVAARVNGRPVEGLRDADPRLGARLEVFAAGQYCWLPFAHITSITLEPPKRLRDLLWAPAVVRTGPEFRGRELGEVLLPVLAPGSARHPEPAVRLGRVTEWVELADGTEAPAGQKLLLGDGDEEFPLLELREVEFLAAPAAVG
jgi:type VI secretion system protein ImpE